MLNTAPTNSISFNTAQALILAVFRVSDYEGEPGGIDQTSPLVSIIDAHIAVQVEDYFGEAQIKIETEQGIQFHAIAVSDYDFHIEVYRPGDWEVMLLTYANSLTPEKSLMFSAYA